MRLRIATILLTAILAASVCAQVKDSSHWLIQTREHSFIKRIQANGLGPATLGRRQLYLLVRLGAGYGDVTAAANPSEDARGLASTLQRTSGFSDAQFSKEDDYAAAEVSFSRAHLFNGGGSWDFDLGRIVHGLEADGWQVFGAVNITKDATSGITTPSFSSATSTVTYRMDGLLDRPIHLEATIGAVTWLLLFLMIFGPLTALSIGFVAAFAIAKRTDIDIVKRRAMYKTVVLRLPLGAIGLCLPIAMISLVSGAFTSISDLWFGTSSVATTLMPAVLLTMPLPFLALMPLTKLENRLFSDKPDKPDFQEPKVVRLTPNSSVRGLVFGVAFLIAGGSLAFYSDSLPKQNSYRSLLRMVGTLVMFGGVAAAGPLASKLNSSKRPVPSDDPLVNRVYAIAEKVNGRCHGVSVVEPGDQTQYPRVGSYDGRISVNRAALNQLSDEALDFGIAYALIEKPYRIVGIMFIAIIPFAFLFAFLAMPWVVKNLPPGARMLVLFGSMAVFAFLVVVPLMKCQREKDGLQQIRETLKAFPNYVAGKEWFEKSLHPGAAIASPKVHEKHRQRVFAQFEQVAKEMSLG